MNWLFFAFLAPALYAVTNHLDKYLLSRYMKGGGIGSLIIFSSLIGIVALPIIPIFVPGVINLSISNALLIIFSSMLFIGGIITYLYALEKDETSVVAPLWQMVPVIGFFLAYFLLGETISNDQLAAIAIILFGALILTVEFAGKKISLKKDIFLLMLASSILLAVSRIVFKFVAIQENFWLATFWGYVGLSIAGILLYFGVKSYRDQFHAVIKKNTKGILGLNFLNEIINIIGELSFTFASLLVPIVLVWTIESTQPFFIFLYGVVLTIFFPKIANESLAKRDLIQKVSAIIIMFLGVYLLNN